MIDCFITAKGLDHLLARAAIMADLYSDQCAFGEWNKAIKNARKMNLNADLIT